MTKNKACNFRTSFKLYLSADPRINYAIILSKEGNIEFGGYLDEVDLMQFFPSQSIFTKKIQYRIKNHPSTSTTLYLFLCLSTPIIF